MARTLNHAGDFGYVHESVARSAAVPRKPVRGFFAKMLQAIADAKMKRIERELRLRGIRYRDLDTLL